MSAKTQSTGQHISDKGAERVAIVTGASQGIGAGIAAALHSSGYAVVGTSRSIEPSEIDNLLTVRGDITKAQTAQRVVGAAMSAFGRIDCLVNDAGMSIEKPFTDYDADDLDRITAVNLVGFFQMTQRVVAHMIRQGVGHIVNITTSMVDHPTAQHPAALTSLTKGGLGAVTRSLAIELASLGIRVNAVAPGVIYNPDLTLPLTRGWQQNIPLAGSAK